MVMAGPVPAVDFLAKALTMFRRVVSAVILVPLAAAIIIFAVANRQSVTVSFDPFSTASPAYAVTLPLFVLIMMLVILGVLIGGTVAWIGQARCRRHPSGAGRHPPPLCAGAAAHARAGAIHGHSAAAFLTRGGSALRPGGEGGKRRVTMPLSIKICGLMTSQALVVALNSGADLVGFVFFP